MTETAIAKHRLEAFIQDYVQRPDLLPEQVLRWHRMLDDVIEAVRVETPPF